MNVIVSAFFSLLIYGAWSKLLVRSQAALMTLPVAILYTLALIHWIGPLTFVILKIVLFLIVKFKLLVAKYLALVLAGFVSILIPPIMLIVPPLVVLLLAYLLREAVKEFYLWLLSLFSRALTLVRRVSDGSIELFDRIGARGLGVVFATAFEIAAIAYPTFLGFCEFVNWISKPASTLTENSVLVLCGIAASAFAWASYRKNTQDSRVVPRDYFDPLGVIEDYLG